MHLNRLWHKGVLRIGFSLILLVLCGCVSRAAEPPEDTLTPSPLPSITASTTASITPEPTPTSTPISTRTPQPTATQKLSLPVPLLPAPLYFISSHNGIQQIWRMERNNGIARPVTNSKQDIVALKKDIGAYDVSRRDGSLAYVSDNKLYVLRPDSTGPELIYTGEELDPEEEWGIQVGKKVSSPLWSRDGKELAFSHNGVQVINIETNKVRSLITNNTVDLEDIMDWRAYSPRNWSPDGKSIAVGVSYYSAGGLILLDAGDGSMRSPGNYGCCSFSFPDNSRYFYIASSGYHGGGFSKADWLTGNAEWLVRPFDSDNFLDISDLVVVDDTLYFFIDDTFARTRIQNIPDYEVVSEAPNISGSILWAPDASMLIVQDWGMHEPMYIWSPGAGLFQLDQRGIELKWGVP
jgi:dipeptidyl aminopeptidase/acylaminoacyl peptidase